MKRRACLYGGIVLVLSGFTFGWIRPKVTGLLNHFICLLDVPLPPAQTLSCATLVLETFAFNYALPALALGVGACLLAAAVPGLERVDSVLQALWHSPHRRRPAILAGAAAVVGVGITLHFTVLSERWGSLDEYGYLFQARCLEQGDLTARLPVERSWVDHTQVAFRGDRWFSKYPPGWPLFLVPGLRLGAEWLVPPILAALCLLALAGGVTQAETVRPGAGMSVTDPAAVGVAGAALVAVSPFFWMNAGTFFPHLPHLLALALFAFGVCRCIVDGRPATAAGASGAWALAFLLRPADTVMVTAPALLGILWRLLQPSTTGGARGRAAVFAAWLSPALTGIALVLIANERMTGSPWRFPYTFADPEDRPSLFTSHGHNLGRALVTTGEYFLRLPIWLPFFVLEAGWRRRKGTAWVGWGLVLLTGMYFLYWGNGGYQYGPRYLIPFLAWVAWMGGRALAAPAADGAAAARRGALVLVSLLHLAAVQAPQICANVLEETRARSDVYRIVEARVSTPALVFLELNPGYTIRVTPDLSGEIVYVAGGAEAACRALWRENFPERTPYRAWRETERGGSELKVEQWPPADAGD